MRTVPHNNLAAGRAACVGRVSSNLPQPTKMVERADELIPPPPPPPPKKKKKNKPKNKNKTT